MNYSRKTKLFLGGRDNNIPIPDNSLHNRNITFIFYEVPNFINIAIPSYNNTLDIFLGIYLVQMSFNSIPNKPLFAFI